MLFQLLGQMEARIEALDVRRDAPEMLRQIDTARPDFLQEMRQRSTRRDITEVVTQAVAAGILVGIKEIPPMARTMAALVGDPSGDLVLRVSLLGALVYLVDPQDLIPDDTPGGYGLVDDQAVVRTAMIQYLRAVGAPHDQIEAQEAKARSAGRLVPLNVLPGLQQAVNGVAMAPGIFTMVPAEILQLTLQQAIANPLQMPSVLQQPGVGPGLSSTLGGGWRNGIYLEGDNIITQGGPSLIDGELFIPPG